jgi:hypothetical protein
MWHDFFWMTHFSNGANYDDPMFNCLTLILDIIKVVSEINLLILTKVSWKIVGLRAKYCFVNNLGVRVREGCAKKNAS